MSYISMTDQYLVSRMQHVNDAKLWESVYVKFTRWDFDGDGNEVQAKFCNFTAYRLRQPDDPKRRQSNSIDVFRVLLADLKFPLDGERFMPGEGDDEFSYDGERSWAYPIGAYVLGDGIVEFTAHPEEPLPEIPCQCSML